MKKSWTRKKSIVLVCGKCHVCGKELLSNQGGWIVNGEGRKFHEDHKGNSCFDKYIARRRV